MHSLRIFSRRAFTLIELLVVIAIIAVLAVVVVLTLNPAQLLAQARDSQRVSDMSTFNTALGLYTTDQGGASSFSLGTSSIIYISVPDPVATTTAGDACQGLGLSSGSYHCAASSSYRAASSTGWLPVAFSSMSAGSPFGNLPVDPSNSTSSGYYYSYATNGSQYETAATMESTKYQAAESSTAGVDVAGSSFSLFPAGVFVGSAVSVQGGTSTTLSYVCTKGDMLVVGVARSYNGTVFSVSDTAGDTFVPATPFTPGTDSFMQMFYVPRCVGGPAIITVSVNGSYGIIQFGVSEYRRPVPEILDSGAGSSGSSTLPTCATTASASGELVIGMIEAYINNPTSSVGYQTRATSSVDSYTAFFMADATSTNGTNSISSTLTYASGFNWWNCALVTFK